MAKPISIKTRKKVIDHVKSGGSQRSAARKYNVSKSFVSDLVKLYNESKDVKPCPMGGDRRSGRTKKFEKVILKELRKNPTATLQEIQESVKEKTNEIFAITTLHDFFKRRNITRKKVTGQALEQRRRDVRIG